MKRVVIWDSWIRLFHWSLVCSIFFMLFSGKTGNGFYDWHRYVGEFVFALILFRICWGLWGSSNGRLINLISKPASVFTHLNHLYRKSLQPERSHNAAGGWATLLMLILIGVQATTGLFIADEDELLEGALYETLSSEWTEQLLQIHYFNSRLIISIVIAHILMIILYRIWGKVNLVRPMITGSMDWPDTHHLPPIIVRHWMIGLITAVTVLIATGLLTGWIKL